jgi:hypothetical protein
VSFQVIHKIRCVPPQFLDLTVVALIVAVNANMNIVLKLRNVSRDFLANDEVRQIAHSVQ